MSTVDEPTVDELKERARAGDLQALQALREQGFFGGKSGQGYPISHAQRRLWIVDQMVEGFGAYNIPIALMLHGRLDSTALREALRMAMRRHKFLRTTFKADDGGVRQFIHDDIDLPWEEFDLSGDAEAGEHARRIAADHGARPFDLSRGPLLSAALVRLAHDRHLFLFNIHHIVSDLVSLGVLSHELSECYEAIAAGRAPKLEPLPIQYKDFAVWQNRLLASDEAARHRAYWLEQLSGTLPPLELPTDFPRPPLKTYRGGIRRISLGAGLTERVRRLGLQFGMTPFMVLAACLKVLLHRYSAQDDIIVGIPLTGRDHPDLANQIGCFVNTVAVRSRLSADEPFSAVLDRVRQTMLDAYEHQSYPFDRLVEELDLPRDMSRSPVFGVSMSLANAEVRPLRFGDVEVLPYDDGFAASKVDLSFDFSEAGDGLELAIAYCTDLFSDERMGRMAEHFVRLTAHAVENPDLIIGRIPLMGPEEEHRVLVEFNRTERAVSAGQTVIGLFERQAETRPDAVAALFAGRRLSYDELNRRANRVARLLADYGVGSETMVGLFMEPSLDMLTCMLGILKAGGVYVPLDPANPLPRLAAMLEDARPPVILTEDALADRLPAGPGNLLLVWEELDAGLAGQEDGNPERAAGPDNAAYVIFTSGSTGRAKGAVLTHGGLANVALEQALLFEPGPGDRVLQFASLGFDASVFEMVMALTSGATLCLYPRDQILPGMALLETLERDEISIVTLPPSALAALPEAGLPKLRLITVAGEACPAELVSRWAQGRAFFNLYGPTETTIWASAARCEPDGQAPTIGCPICNTRIYILDRHLKPVPYGIPGELCIAGAGLARHYLNRPDLTGACFVPDPFDPTPDARLYRTGDRARHLADGEIEFLGRIDHQMKLRGYRIEPGEIEAVLAGHPAVRDAAVLAREVAPGDLRLTAYATPRSLDARPDARDLRKFLQDRLPEYMVPAKIVLLDRMSMTTSNKIDRKALPDPDSASADPDAAFIPPRDDLELALAGFFAEVLRMERIGAGDDFFQLGGNSLLATRIVSLVRDFFRVDITIPQLLRAGTVGALAGTVRDALPAGHADRIAAVIKRLRGMSDEEKERLLSKTGGDGR